MLYIRIIFPMREKGVVRILRNSENKLAIRQALSSMFMHYSLEQIVIIPEPLSDDAMDFADNLLPLTLVIDVGKHNGLIENYHSDILRSRLIDHCPELGKINFGVWIREFPSNGFTEHKPE